MARQTPVIPAETVMLCEGCGYALTGLPEDARCPECGKPIVESVGENPRKFAAWEIAEGFTPMLRGFVATTAHVLFRPTDFFKHLASRAESRRVWWFAFLHWIFASVLFAVSVLVHLAWTWQSTGVPRAVTKIGPFGVFAVMFASALSVLGLTTHLAAKLTAWEAAYRGYRLPMPVVLRAMYYHAAHYLPVAVVVYITVGGFKYLFEHGRIGPESATTYLYILCGEVVVGAAYLFNTYWIGMRNMLYANR